MLKLTKKADYGLIALRHITVSPRATASAKEIADGYHIPLPLLAKVLQKLAKAGLLRSVSGTNGGYKLSRDPRAINALEVIHAIDGPTILASCFTSHGVCDQSDRCTVREPLRRVHEAILGLLANMTIWQMSQPVNEGPDAEPYVPQNQPLSQLLSL